MNELTFCGKVGLKFSQGDLIRITLGGFYLGLSACMIQHSVCLPKSNR